MSHRGTNSPHPAVDWAVMEHGPAGPRVQITCPACAVSRFAAAKWVRHHIKLGTFTGLCRTHMHVPRRALLLFPSHPAVQWNTTAPSSGDAQATVTCPICGQSRTLPERLVRYGLKHRDFDGRCKPHRFVGKDQSQAPHQPPHPYVDWETTERGEKGLRVSVTCPVCHERRWDLARSVRRRIKVNTFTGRCLRHRLIGRPRKGSVG
jgi:hypothetical protein